MDIVLVFTLVADIHYYSSVCSAQEVLSKLISRYTIRIYVRFNMHLSLEIHNSGLSSHGCYNSHLCCRFLNPSKEATKLHVCNALFEWISLYFDPLLFQNETNSLLLSFLRFKLLLEEEPYRSIGASILKMYQEQVVKTVITSNCHHRKLEREVQHQRLYGLNLHYQIMSILPGLSCTFHPKKWQGSSLSLILNTTHELESVR